MSAEMGTCSGCGLKKRLSPKGLVYVHPNPLLPGEECEGSRKPVRTVEIERKRLVADPIRPNQDQVLAAVEDFRASLKPTGKRTWRQRVRDRLKKWEDMFDDALDVFDD